MSTVTEYASQHTTLSEASPDATDRSQVITLSGDASAGFRGLLDIEHGTPLGEDASIVSATLYLYKASAWSATADLDVQRVDASWDAETATWTNQPGVETGTETVTVATGGAAGDEISIDVTSLIAAGFNAEEAGTDTYNGLRLSISETGTRELYGSTVGNLAFQPRLEVEYNLPPDEPSDLIPSDGLAVSLTQPLLSWTHFDEDAEDVLSAVRVQVKTGSDDFTSPTYDSGWVTHNEPNFDLANEPAGAAVPGTFAAGTTHYWRVAVRDNHSGESDWSDTASWVRVAKGSLTLDTPTAIDSPVPVITHTLSGATQEEVEIEVERLEDGIWQEHYYLPRYVTTSTSHTVPDENALEEGFTYRITVRVWDTEDRDDIPGDRAFYSASLTGAF